MDVTALSLTTVVLFLPLIGLIPLLFIREVYQARWIALGFSLLTFVASILLWLGFDASKPGLQLVQRNEWLPQYGISYYVGVDGLSILLILLTTFIMPLAI